MYINKSNLVEESQRRAREVQNTMSEQRKLNPRQLASHQQRPQSSHPLTSQPPLPGGASQVDEQAQPFSRKMILQEKLLSNHEEGVGADEVAYPTSVPNQRYYGST